jgi:hypothetical protein
VLPKDDSDAASSANEGSPAKDEDDLRFAAIIIVIME